MDFAQGQSTCFAYDESHDKLVFKFDQVLTFNKESSMLSALTERFIRINAEIFRDMNVANGVVSLVHGEYVSITDFSSVPYDDRLRIQKDRPWVHFKNTQAVARGRA